MSPTQRRGTRALLAAALSLVACRSEPPPPLAVEGTSNPDAAETNAPEAPPPRSDGPWFIEGPGAQAMALRARGDHTAALEVLPRVAAPEASADAAVAALLLGDSARAKEDWSRAAEAFARARSHESLAPIEGTVRLWEAQARLDAGDPAAAMALLEGLESDPSVAPELWLTRADAAVRLDQREAAVADYKRYLEAADIERAWEARAKLARALGGSGDGTAEREAAGIWARLVQAIPLSDYASEGRSFLAEGGEAKLQRDAKARREAQRAETLAELDARLSRRQYTAVEKAAKKEAAKKGLPKAYQCELLYLQGSAIFKQRDRARARAVFERAAKTCASAKNRDLEVKTRYQAARGRYAEGKYSQAAKAFESLALDHPSHSYADDAWIKAGESWESAKSDAKARKAYTEALRRHPDGDMRAEARRRAVLLAFAESPKAALETIEAGLGGAGVGEAERAKLLYFRARAKARAGESAEAVEADLLEALALRPLDYSGLQAMSRLHELGPESYAKGMAVLEGEGEGVHALAGEGGEPLPSLAPEGMDAKAEARAKLWARLGFGDLAWRELSGVGVRGWPAVALAAEAGDFAGAQRRLADLGTNWRKDVPREANRAHWELAHPRPFAVIIEAGEPERQVPPDLTFAIMQTESRFDPNVVSWAGARGLVQLMPATAEDLASRAGIELGGGDLFVPSINLQLGMLYLGRLAARFGGGNGGAALAAPSYNAGAGSVDKWIAARGDWDLDLFIEAIPYDETRRYTQSVMGRWFAYRWLYAEGEARVPLLPLATPKRAG